MGFRVVEENLRNTAAPKRSDNARFNFLFSVMPGEAFVSGSAACSRCLEHIYTRRFVLYSVYSWGGVKDNGRRKENSGSTIISSRNENVESNCHVLQNFNSPGIL